MRESRAHFALVVLMLVALCGSLAWGFLLDRQPRPPHIPPAQALPVDSVWYRTLPLDPDASTAHYLARIPPDSRARSDAFGSAYNRAIPLTALAGLLATLLLLHARTAARVQRFAARLTSRPFISTFLVAGTTQVVLWTFAFPSNTYQNFVLPWRAGMLYSSFREDIWWLMLAGLTSRLFLGVIVAALYVAARGSLRRGATILIAVCALWAVFGATVKPFLNDQYFDDAIPLSSEPSTAKVPMIQAYARINGIPAGMLWLQAVNQQEKQYAAGITGVGPFAHILFDEDILTGLSDDEIRFVLAHEFAHEHRHDNLAALLLHVALTSATVLLVLWATRALIARYGSTWGISHALDIRAFPLLLGVYSLLEVAETPLHNSWARSREAAADRYALQITANPIAMAEYLVRGGETAEVHPSRLDESLFSDHPSVYNRVLMAMRWRRDHAN